MKNISPIIIFISIIVIVLLGFVIYFIVNPNNKGATTTKNEIANKEEYTEITDDGIKRNISSKLQETKRIGDLEVGNIELIYTNGTTNLTAQVYNDSKEESQSFVAKITLLDKSGDNLCTLEAFVKKLNAGQSTTIDMSTKGDYTNAYNFEIEKK